MIGESGIPQAADVEHTVTYYDIFIRHAFGNVRDIIQVGERVRVSRGNWDNRHTFPFYMKMRCRIPAKTVFGPIINGIKVY